MPSVGRANVISGHALAPPGVLFEGGGVKYKNKCMSNIAIGNNNLEELMAGCVDATSVRSLRFHCREQMNKCLYSVHTRECSFLNES